MGEASTAPWDQPRNGTTVTLEGDGVDTFTEAFPMHPNDSAALKAEPREVSMELWDDVEGYCRVCDSFDCEGNCVSIFPTRPPDLDLLSE